MNKITTEELKGLQGLPLEDKIAHAVQVILRYYLHYKGQVYLTFSGGKDSQVVLEILRRMFNGTFKKYFAEVPYEYGLTPENCMCYGEVPALFAGTGLEKPEIRKHAMSFSETTKTRPKKKFVDVIKEEGYAVGSKLHARLIRNFNDNPSSRNLTTRTFALTGVMPSGKKTQSKIPKRYHHLLDRSKMGDLPDIEKHGDFTDGAPLKITDKCCDYFKKEPFRRYQKATGRKPITGTMAEESLQRMLSYMSSGCNTFSGGKSMSRPLSIWKVTDIWAFHDKYSITFASCYYEQEIEYQGMKIPVEGSQREGCMFCLFGIEFDERQKKKGERKFNRFEKLAITHPRQHRFMVKELGFDNVANLLNFSHTPEILPTFGDTFRLIGTDSVATVGKVTDISIQVFIDGESYTDELKVFYLFFE